MTEPPAGFAGLLVGALQASETVALSVLDEDLRYVWASEATLRSRGMEPSEVIGHTLVEVFGEPFITDTMNEVMRRGFDGPVSEVVVLGDGRDRNVVAFPMAVDGRRCVGSIATRLLPSTQRLLTTHRLRESLITDSAEIGLWVWNRATGEAWWNRWVDQMLEHDPAKARSLSEFQNGLHIDDRSLLTEAFQVALETGTMLEVTYRMELADGGQRVVRSRGQLSPDDPEVMIGVLIDVTEVTHAAERDAAMQRAALEAIDLERDRIAADIHDGPLQGLSAAWLRLSTLAARLDAGAPLDDAAARSEFAELARSVATSVANTNQELRDVLGRLRSLPIDASTDMFATQVSDLVDELREHQAFEVDVSFDFGGLDTLADSVLSALYRIVAEALINAARHGEASSVAIRVGVRGDVLEASVIDDGVGFDVAAPAPSGHFGLSVMRQRARSLQGSLVVESKVGRGTTVRVRLPLRDPGEVDR